MILLEVLLIILIAIFLTKTKNVSTTYNKLETCNKKLILLEKANEDLNKSINDLVNYEDEI